MLRSTNCMLSLVIAMIVAGCGEPAGDPREKEVVKGVARVKSLINSTATNPMAALSLASMAGQGGNIVSHIAASLPDNETFTCYIEGPRPQPYCVVIRSGAAPGEYLIEGYGASIDKPVASEKALAASPKRH